MARARRRTAKDDSELTRACGLDPLRDRQRISLMLELVDRAGRAFERYARTEAAPTSRAKRRQVQDAVRAMSLMRKAYDQVRSATSTWSVGGPTGSPDMARLPLWRFMTRHLAVRPLPFDYVRVLLRDDQPVHAVTWKEEADVKDSLRVVPSDGLRGRLSDVRFLPATIQDAAFADPALIAELLGAISAAAERTLEAVSAAGQTRKSELPRDTFMRDLALVFHAMHRTPARGSKAARARFVHVGLTVYGAAIGDKAVENQLRTRALLRGPDGEGARLGDVPAAVEFDAIAALEAFSRAGADVLRLPAELRNALGEAAAPLLVAGGPPSS